MPSLLTESSALFNMVCDFTLYWRHSTAFINHERHGNFTGNTGFADLFLEGIYCRNGFLTIDNSLIYLTHLY